MSTIILPIHTRLIFYFRKLATIFALGLIPVVAVAQFPIVGDNFDNGVVADGGAGDGYWRTFASVNSSVVEGGGKVTLSSGGTSADPYYTILHTQSVSNDFDFFNKKLRFSADVSLSGSSTYSSTMYFALSSVPGYAYDSDDFLSLALNTSNSVQLSRNQDKPRAVGINLINGATVGGSITRFELTLDATDYTLVVYFQGGSQTFTGAHGLIGSRWGDNGKTGVLFQTFMQAAGGSAQTTVATVDNFEVLSYAPQVALFEDVFSNNAISHSNRENNVWTHIAPQNAPFNSTVSEATGRLVQRASSTSSGPVIVAANTPREGRFNFFDNQIQVRVKPTTATSDGNAYVSARFGLVSEAGLSHTSDDAIIAGFTPTNHIFLTAKNSANSTNGYTVDPEWTNVAGVSALFNRMQLGVVSEAGLTVNSKRFRLLTFSGDRSNGIARFTGEHGLTRAGWGANGNASVVLESNRGDAALANGAAVSSWDDLTIEANSSKVLNEPFVDFTAAYPIGFGGNQTGSYRIWLPSTEPVIRGLIFIAPGDGVDMRGAVHDLAAQEVARALGFGLVGYTFNSRMNLMGNNPAAIKAAIQAVLDRAAQVTGRPELSNVPLCWTGFSRGAFDSCFLARNWPERVITIVPFCGGEWSNFTMTPAIKTVPVLFVGGSTDANSLTDPFIMQNSFNFWRSQGGLAAFAVNWNVGHTLIGNQGWESALAWIAEVSNVRYPRPMMPPQTPATLPALLSVPEESGWLGQRSEFSGRASSYAVPSVTQPFATVAPYNEYVGTKSNASWIPTATMAKVYRVLTSTDLGHRNAVPTHSPLRIISPAQFEEPTQAGSVVTIRVDPRDFSYTTPIAAMEFYVGETLLGTVTSGSDWSFSFIPLLGSHQLTVVATDSSGNKRDAYRQLNVIPADFRPLAVRQSLSVVSGQATNGTLLGIDPEGNSVTFAISEHPARGTVSIEPSTGAYTYTSDAGYVGTDFFAFTANDGNLNSIPAQVLVNGAAEQIGPISSVTAQPGVQIGEISLSWSGAYLAETYAIERSTVSNSGFTQIGLVNAPTVTFSDINLPLNQTFYYRIRGANAALQTVYSSVVSSQANNVYGPVGTVSTPVASAGSGLGQINLSWTAAAGVTGYKIERAVPSQIQTLYPVNNGFESNNIGANAVVETETSAVAGWGATPGSKLVSNNSVAGVQGGYGVTHARNLNDSNGATSTTGQALLIQSYSGGNINQLVSGFRKGTASITFRVQQWKASAAPEKIHVYFNNLLISTFTTTNSQTWETFTSATFQVPATGAYNVTFQGEGIHVFLDDISITNTLEPGNVVVGTFSEVADLGTSFLNFTDTNLIPNQPYYYRVRAYNPTYPGLPSPQVSALASLPATIAGWRYTHFGSGSPVPGLSGITDSPAGDGLTNLLKYALGIVPTQNQIPVPASQSELPTVEVRTLNSQEMLTISFTRNKTASDVSFLVDVSSDLTGAWTALDPLLAANQVSVTDNSPRTGLQTIVVKDTQPVSSQGKRFIRLRVVYINDGKVDER